MLKNGIYNMTGTVISFLLSLLTIPLLIKIIGISDYGLWTLVTATIGIFGLAEAGLSVSTTVFLSRDLAENDADGISQTLTVTIGFMFLIATSVGIILWWGAPLGINLFPKLDNTQRLVAIQAFQLGGLVIWAKLLQQILLGVIQAHRRYDLATIMTTGQTAILNIGLLVVVWQGGRIMPMMEWQAVVVVAVLLVLVVIAQRLLSPVDIYPRWSKTKAQALIRYSSMTWLVSLSGALFSQFDRVIVGAMLGTSVLGVYGAITSVTSKINSLSAAPVQPLLPELSTLMARPTFDHVAVERRVKQALSLNTCVALGMGAVLFGLAPTIIQVMLPNNTDTRDYIIIFQIAVIIYALYSPNAVGYYILLGNAVKSCMIVQLASAGVSLLLIAVGAHTFGLLGAILGNSGYLGVWLLTFLGMKILDISVAKWVRWFSVPLTWFFITIIILLFVEKWLFFRLIGLALGTVMLIVWWLREQHINWAVISGHLFAQKKTV